MELPTLEHERELWAAGYRRIAGLDEVGRGAWAGPVVAAAVILPVDRADLQAVLGAVNDSKRLTPRKREALFPLICDTALAIGIGSASSDFIDASGIVPATRKAMLLAIRNLSVWPDFLLVDALRLAEAGLPQRGLVHGDARVLSIASASIVAKVYRDRWMVELDQDSPGYDFSSHKGYGTPRHRAALQRLGPCSLHRRSFAPVRCMLQS
jgi:ribonuclease HII